MSKFEKKIIEFIQKNIFKIFFIIISITGLLIRYPLRNIYGPDMNAYIGWLEQAREYGGIKSLSQSVGAYNMLFQTIFAFLSYIPGNPVYIMKGFSIFFDYVLAIAVSGVVYAILKDYEERDRSLRVVISYTAILFSPGVLFNSSVLGQTDSSYVAFLLLSLLALLYDRCILGFCLFGVAIAFKLQAIFLFPFLLFYYFYKKSFSIMPFFLIPIIMVVLSLPKILNGRSIKEIITIYSVQTKEGATMYTGYPSFWCFLSDKHGGDFKDFYRYKIVAIIFAVVILAILMLILLTKMKEMTMRNMIYCAFILAYTCVLFLPSMYERYGYLYEVLAIAIACFKKKTIPLVLILQIMISYRYIGNSPFSLQIWSYINIAIYMTYIFILMKEMIPDNKVWESK